MSHSHPVRFLIGKPSRDGIIDVGFAYADDPEDELPEGGVLSFPNRAQAEAFYKDAKARGWCDPLGFDCAHVDNVDRFIFELAEQYCGDWW